MLLRKETKEEDLENYILYGVAILLFMYSLKFLSNLWKKRNRLQGHLRCPKVGASEHTNVRSTRQIRDDLQQPESKEEKKHRGCRKKNSNKYGTEKWTPKNHYCANHRYEDYED
ncbi:hypothetical protein ACJJTC_006669 [Scirpophaga incertulas]